VELLVIRHNTDENIHVAAIFITRGPSKLLVIHQ